MFWIILGMEHWEQACFALQMSEILYSIDSWNPYQQSSAVFFLKTDYNKWEIWEILIFILKKEETEDEFLKNCRLKSLGDTTDKE